MKTLCIIAIGTLLVVSPATGYAQAWKDKLGGVTGGTKKGKVYGNDLSEEDVDLGVYHRRKTDDGIVSEYQKEHLNQIVFSGKKLNPDEVNTENTKTKFSINDPIYFNLILPQSLPNYVVYPQDENGEFISDYCYDFSSKRWYASDTHGAYNTDRGMPVRNIHGTVQIDFYLDGELYNCPVTMRNVNTNSTQTIYSDYIFADPEKFDPSPDWVDLVQNLSEGEHEIKLVVYGLKSGSDIKKTKAPIAEGSFTLVRKPGESFTPKFNLSWRDYKAGLNDYELNGKILKAIQTYGKDNGFKETFDAIKVSSKAWIITRNKLTSVVTGRNLVVYCKAKWPDGFCKVQRFVFRQEHNGSGFESEINCLGVYWNSSAKAIDCE